MRISATASVVMYNQSLMQQFQQLVYLYKYMFDTVEDPSRGAVTEASAICFLLWRHFYS